MSEHTAHKKDPVTRITEVARTAFADMLRERNDAIAAYDRLREHLKGLNESKKKLEQENQRLREDNAAMFEELKKRKAQEVPDGQEEDGTGQRTT